MYLSATTEQQRHFLEEMADSYSFIGDMRIAFLCRFDPIKKDKINHTLAGDITNWNKTPENENQKLLDELKKIYDVLEKDGCNLGDRKAGRKPKGKTPWEQAFKWLWEIKYPEWLKQQSIPISDEQDQKNAVCQFLEEVEKRFNHISLFPRQQPIFLKDQYIPIQVTLERKYNHEVETTWSYPESEAEFKRVYALKGSEESQRNQVDWTEAKQKLKSKPIMVLADPGMGKTTLLKIEAYLTAQQERESLKGNSKNLEEVFLPLFLRLSDIAKATNEVTSKSIDTILSLIESKYEINFPSIKSVLEEKLKTGKCLLLFDSLDEVPKENRDILSEKLNDFLRNYPCHIICTSRIVGYSGAFLEGMEEVEIVPFSQKQVDKYIEIWFKNKPEDLHNNSVLASSLIRELQNKPQIRGLTQNPLLLSLICSLYQQKDLTLPTRRCQVYEQAVRYMLSKWRQQRNSELNDGWIDAKTELLEELAYQFSCDNKAIFTMRELRSKIDEYKRTGKASTDFDNISPSSLITELSEQDGILQKPHKDSSDQYLFLHRTFQEYLTACYLNHSDSGIALAKDHLWDYEWHETLSLMAGMMKNPVPLLEAITNEKDDIFSTLLLLAGKCIAECEMINHHLIVHILNGNEKAVEPLAFALSDDEPEVGSMAALALSEIAKKVAVDSLIWQKVTDDLILALSKEKLNIAQEVAFALSQIGTEKAINTLIYALEKNKNPDKRSQVALALGKIKIEKIDDYLISALSDEDSNVRENVAIALGNIGTDKAINALISLLSNSESQMRSVAVAALGKTGAEKAIEALIKILNDEDSNVRSDAVWYLGEIGTEKAVNALVSVLVDEDVNVRSNAAKALGKIGSAKAVDGLINALTDRSRHVRRDAAWSLGKIRSQEAVDALVSALGDKDGYVRANAAEALGKIGTREAIHVLFSTLSHNELYVRINAAWALNKIGSSEMLRQLLKLHNIDICIYQPEVFILARKLAVSFRKEKVDFIPVYPELLGTSFDN